MPSSITEILSESEDTFRWPVVNVVGSCPRDPENPRRWLIHEVGVHPGDVQGTHRCKVGGGIVVCENVQPRMKGRIVELEHGGPGSGMVFKRLVVDVFDEEAEWFQQRSNHPKNLARRQA